MNEEDEGYSPVHFLQIKEKFGGLRLYYSGGDSYIAKLVDEAERKSYETCECCGSMNSTVKMRDVHGWMYTGCSECVRKE